MVSPAVFRSLIAITLIGALSVACEGVPLEGDYPEDRRRGAPAPTTTSDLESRETVFGEGGLNVFGDDDKKSRNALGGSGIGVNSFLWRASLDTIAFMPVNSADPFGGVIITDWHSPPETPRERFKMNVYILGRTLRADGVRVAVFRQVQDNVGSWRDAPIAERTGTQIEDAILTKARQLGFETLQQ